MKKSFFFYIFFFSYYFSGIKHNLIESESSIKKQKGNGIIFSKMDLVEFVIGTLIIWVVCKEKKIENWIIIIVEGLVRAK